MKGLDFNTYDVGESVEAMIMIGKINRFSKQFQLQFQIHKINIRESLEEQKLHEVCAKALGEI